MTLAQPPSRGTSLRTLLLRVDYSVRASYYEDWRDAFLAHPDLAVSEINLFEPSERARVAPAAREADLVVVLHSGTGDGLDEVRAVTPALKDRRGRLVVFMANEFNIPWLPISSKRAWAAEAGTDVIATQLVQRTGEWLYEGSGARVISLPHALNPEAFAWKRPRAERSRDIGTRSFPYPIYLGDDSRNRLLASIAELAAQHGLNADLRLDQRFARPEWAAFLNDCRFTAATEAGTPYLERDDGRALAVRDFLNARRKGFAVRPDLPGRSLLRRLPWSWRQAAIGLAGRIGVKPAGLEADPVLAREVHERFFADAEPCPFPSTCISSRHLDAAGCGTVQLLVEGHYNGVLEAGRHYLPVRPDLSDLGALLGRLREPGFADGIAEAAAAHARERHTHRHRIDALLAFLD